MQVRQRLSGAFRSVRESFKSLETNPKLKTFTRSISLRASKTLHKGGYATSHHRLVPDTEPRVVIKSEAAEVTDYTDQDFDMDNNSREEPKSPLKAKLSKGKRATVRKASEAFRRLSVSLSRSKRKRQKRRMSTEDVEFEESASFEGHTTTIWNLRAQGLEGSSTRVESEDIIGTIAALEKAEDQVGGSLKLSKSKKGLGQKTKNVRKAFKKSMVAWADAMSYPVTGSDSTVYTTCSLCNRAREMDEYRPNLGSCYRCHSRLYQDTEATLYQTCQVGW